MQLPFGRAENATDLNSIFKWITKNRSIPDFYIKNEKEKGYPGWINLIGIESPGLTASLAIGNDIAKKSVTTGQGSSGDTDASQMKGLGDIVAYHNNTTVDWLGFYAQGNYVSGPINAYGMIGQSSIAYSYQDMFTIFQKKITADAISTMQIKGELTNKKAPHHCRAFLLIV